MQEGGGPAARAGRGARPRRRAAPAAHQAARAELRHRPQHRAPDRAGRRGRVRDDVVVEVGPGLGSLTLGLLAVVDRVVAVEIDPLLAEALPHTVADRAPGRADRLTVVEADALTVTAADLPGPAPTALVANLPYNVAVPVLLHLLEVLPSLAAASGHGAGRGGRPAGRRPGVADLRRPVGQGALVRRRPPGRTGRPLGLLAGPQRRLRAGGAAPPRAPVDDREPRGGLRRGRRGLRPAAQDPAGRAGRLGRVAGRGRGGAAPRPASTRRPAASSSPSPSSPGSPRRGRSRPPHSIEG